MRILRCNMAQITPTQVSEMREMRGNGLSLNKIATLLSEKYGIEISHQTVSYHLSKFKKKMLDGNKPVRVISVESMSAGPRVFSLTPEIFEKERIKDFVYQDGKSVFELRSGCMHNTQLPPQANDDTYDQWKDVFAVGADPNLPHLYAKTTMISDDAYKRAFNSHEGNDGTQWLRKQSYNDQIFQNADVCKKITKILEGYYNDLGHEAVRLTGDTAKDVITLHSIYGSQEEMKKRLIGFVRPNLTFWRENIDRAWTEFIKSTGIPPARRRKALEVGCLDKAKLAKYYDGKFKDWAEFEKAIESGFLLSKEWTEAVKLRCSDKTEYDLVKKHNWPSGHTMRSAINAGFKHKESKIYAELAGKNLLRYPDVVKWIRAKPSQLKRIDQFTSLKALQLYDEIIGGVYKSKLVVTSKIMEKYNSLTFPGPRFNYVEQMEELLLQDPFNTICVVDVEAGSVILEIKKQKSKSKTSSKPAIDLQPFGSLIASKSKYAKTVIKRINDHDLDDATASTWRWLFLHGKKLLEDQRAPRFAETLCNTISEVLSLSDEENNALHHLRRARNDFDKANEEGTQIKPKWSLIENGLMITERLIKNSK